jgi:hypothetical protein
MKMECTKEEEISQIKMQRPHVVILGAGASRAAFPSGDKNGKPLPLMNDLIDMLGLSTLLDTVGVNYKGRNFEEVYDELYKDAKYSGVRKELEEAIYDYFNSLELPDSPTLYDHLVLSLRGKDVIATFNWDPFLLLAYRRNGMSGRNLKLPRLQFLHGNVKIGFCEKDKITGALGARCSQCGGRFTPSKLLYPIGKKNYHLDEFISQQWSDLKSLMEGAFMMTIFGYSAPVSDVEAINLMKTAWGTPDQRYLEEIEIIDRKDEKELRVTWKPFIHTHHYITEKDFYDSWIGNHPRRTGEAYMNQYLDALLIENNPLPRSADFPELWDWFDKLREIEEQHGL